MTDSQKLDLILSELHGVKDDVQGLKSEVQNMKTEIQDMKGDIKVLKNDMQKLSGKVAGIEFHLENVTDRNICFVAEGHLDLSRKLDEALRAEHLKEMYFIRTNMMADEIRKIKERLAETA